MKQGWVLLVSFMGIVLAPWNDAFAGESLVFKGELSTVAGRAAPDGAYDLEFSIYDAPRQGRLLWQEPAAATPVHGGSYSVTLGTRVPLMLPDRKYWLEIIINGETLSPRSEVELRASTRADCTVDGNLFVSGNAQVADGTDGAPAFSFVNAPTTGLFRPLGSASMAFTTDSIERMRIDAAGQIGIGTAAPGAKLHVNAGELLLTPGAFNSGAIGLGTPNGERGMKLTGPYNRADVRFNDAMLTLALGLNTSGPPSPTNGMAINLLGKVGIGTTTPNHRLRIVGGPSWTSSQWGGALELENGAAIGWRDNANNVSFGIGHTSGGFYMFRTPDDPGTHTTPDITYDLVIDDAGRVGIGRGIGPFSEKLEVAGGASKTIGGSTWIDLSDRRVKTDIQDVDHALEVIGKLRPVKFRYTEECRKKNPGYTDRSYFNYVAQEYQQVFPDSVHEGADGYLQLSIHNSNIYVVKAVQELHQLVKAKDAEILAQKAQLQTLEARLTALEESR